MTCVRTVPSPPPLLKVNILILMALFGIEMLWGYLAGFSIEISSISLLVFLAMLFMGIGLFYTYIREDIIIVNLMMWLAVFWVIYGFGAPLSYIAASANFPLVDSYLFAFDQSLGLDWVSYASLITSSPTLLSILTTAYSLTLWIFLAVLVFLGLTGRHEALGLYITSFLITVIAVGFLSALLPAVTPYAYLGLSADNFQGFKPLSLNEGAINYFLSDFNALRDGSLRELSIGKMTGIVTFPSFHAVLTFVTVLAMRGTGWFYYPVLVMFVITLFAIPVVGGHYFIDVFIGLALTWVAWKMAEKLQGYAAEEKGQENFPLQNVPT